MDKNMDLSAPNLSEGCNYQDLKLSETSVEGHLQLVVESANVGSPTRLGHKKKHNVTYPLTIVISIININRLTIMSGITNQLSYLIIQSYNGYG